MKDITKEQTDAVTKAGILALAKAQANLVALIEEFAKVAESFEGTGYQATIANYGLDLISVNEAIDAEMSVKA